MNSLIVILIEKIKDEAVKGAIFRLYNNLRAFIGSLILSVSEFTAFYFIQNGYPETLKDFLCVEMWEWVAVAVLLQMLGIASLDKYSREIEG